MEILDVVDGENKVIGQVHRYEVHQKGLLHREVHIWLYTPQGELIWQLRSKTKESFPGLLDATIGGHVSAGESYEEAAIKEAREETGLNLKPSDLKLISTVKKDVYDNTTGVHNNTLRRIYAVKYSDKISDLKIEPGEGEGFEAWPIQKLLNLSDTDKKRFITNLLDNSELEMYKKISLLANQN